MKTDMTMPLIVVVTWFATFYYMLIEYGLVAA